MNMIEKVAAGVAVAAALGGGGWYLYVRNADANLQTMVLRSGADATHVSVSGTVKAAQSVDLGFAQSGRIAGVYATVGQTVSAGTVLAETENGDVRALVAQKEAALEAAQADLASLEAGTRQEALAVTQTAVASDQSALQQSEQSLVNAIRSAYTQSDNAVHNVLDLFIDNPDTATPRLTFTASDSQLSTALLNDRVSIEPLLNAWKTDAALLVPAVNLNSVAMETDSDLTAVASLLREANAALNAGIPSGTVTQATLDGYLTSIASARASIDAAQTAMTAAETARTTAQAALDHDTKTLALQQAGPTPQNLDAQKAAVAAAEADLENARAQLTKTRVTAPFDGVVTRMDAKVGEVVSPSSSEISMMSLGDFQIECYVPEVNIADVAVGDSATSTLDAYGSGVEFPARVIAIDPSETIKNGISTYKTTLEFTTADARIRSGMTANVDIANTGTTSGISVPLGAVLQKSDGAYVQLLHDDALETIKVTLGPATSFGYVAVLSGLHDGDTLVLDPKQ